MKIFIILCIIWCCAQAKVNLKADTETDKDWWETTVIYQIYPRSFKDSDGDGVGDLNGITEKLDYIKETGIGAIWLSPIFKSPMVDFGYDIQDFLLIDPIFGTKKDFEKLTQKAKELGIKIIFDFVPNHTSDLHEWFVKSCQGDPKYKDYYVWMNKNGTTDKGEPIPPNNWQSVFYGSAWEWNNTRQQFYLHQFHKRQPDLNYRNENVIKEMNDILKYWLDNGVDGFRVDAINHLFEAKDMPNEPRNPGATDKNDYSYTDHIYTKDQNETYDVVYKWRKLLDDYKIAQKTDTKILLTEAYANLTFTHRFYGNGTNEGSQIPFNFGLIGEFKNNNSMELKNLINSWLSTMPAGKEANWVLGNHDNSRVGSRFKEIKLIPVFNTLLLTLPGVAITYQGEEIGMIDNTDITWNETRDPQAINKNDSINFLKYSRDPERTPFQWDTTDFAGFMISKKNLPWLPVNKNYKTLNLATEKNLTNSVYNHYKSLVNLRKQKIFTNGNFNMTTFGEKGFVYSRTLDNKACVILLNFGNKNETLIVNKFKDISKTMEVLLSGPDSSYKIGSIVNTDANITLKPYDSFIMISSSGNTITISLVLFMLVALIQSFF